VLVLTVALVTSLIVFNNVTDYGSNYQFVKHVLSMDTTFPGNSGLWRRIESPALHHAAYVLIILAQVAIAAMTWVGGARMWSAASDPQRFVQPKQLAIAGLTAGVVLYVGGFLAIGGEWFLMWQSKSWNAQQSAAMFATIFAVVLMFVAQGNGDER
jgi:predicted small integral membrane protein